jgi:hypothetical protein
VTKRAVRSSKAATLAGALAALATLDFNQLQARWQALFGSKPQFRISRRLLLLAIAYRLQEDALGGLQPDTRRRLAQLGSDHPAPASEAVRTMMKPGTTLVREWGGVSHQVMIVEGGVMFGGQRYRSLTQVADLITGTHWSGPRFFGVTPGVTTHGTG